MNTNFATPESVVVSDDGVMTIVVDGNTYTYAPKGNKKLKKILKRRKKREKQVRKQLKGEVEKELKRRLQVVKAKKRLEYEQEAAIIREEFEAKVAVKEEEHQQGVDEIRIKYPWLKEE